MEIVSRRKINKVMGKIPVLSQDDVIYLTDELNQRKRSLFGLLQRKATYRNPEKTSKMAHKLALINEGLNCLYTREFSDPQKLYVLKKLFDDEV